MALYEKTVYQLRDMLDKKEVSVKEVLDSYIKRIEDNLADRKIDRLKKSYKKTKKLNIFLAMTTIISILLAIFI